MLLLFDIDGTIIDTQQVESQCFAQAIEETTGIEFTDVDWSIYPDPTSSGIVQQLFASTNKHVEQIIKDRFVELLYQARPVYPADFLPITGASEFIELLKQAGFNIAFASGGFDTEAAFKLSCCGLHLADFTYATSSDHPSRLSILPLAIERAGYTTNNTLYFGDAPWDVSATQRLGIQMIGIGRRINLLESLGVQHVFCNYQQPDKILALLQRLTTH